MKNIFSLVAELTRRSLDCQRIPFEYRPVMHFKNVPVQQRRLGRPNGFYLGAEGNSVVLVYDDEIIEYQFDDMSVLEAQVRQLETLKIQRLDFANGLAKFVFVLAAFVVFLQCVVWLLN